MRRLTPLAASGALLCAVSIAVAAQDPPLRTLSKVDFEYSEPFSCISGLRELSDGRIVVADQREKTVQIVNLRTGAAVKVGREGQGPGEWSIPAGLFPGHGDTTLLWDQGNRRFLPVNPDGTTGKEFTTNVSTSGGITTITAPRGVDRQGRIYLPGPEFSRGASGGPPVAADSIPILRYDPSVKKLDTLGFLGIPKVDIQTETSGTNRMVMIMAPNPLFPQATWTVTADGRVAVLQPEPYHLEWLSPAKQKTVGPTIRYSRLPVTQADKDALPPVNNCFSTITIGGPAGAAAGRSGGSVTGAGRPVERRAAPRDDWPEFKPPFLGGGRFTAGNVVSAPNGDIWVPRTRPAGDDVPTYDLFDARGQVTGRIALPKGMRFVAFGNGTVYLSRMDDDDLLYIQRYRLDQAR
jgi:hypothetical protein